MYWAAEGPIDGVADEGIVDGTALADGTALGSNVGASVIVTKTLAKDLKTGVATSTTVRAVMVVEPAATQFALNFTAKSATSVAASCAVAVAAMSAALLVPSV